MKRIIFIVTIISNAISLSAQNDTSRIEKATIFVEKMPEFTGGQEALVNYLMKNIKYPEEEIKEGNEGVVYVSFIIDKDGKVTNAHIVKGVNDNFNNEALRVVNQMPNWIPVEKDGKKISSQFNLPIKFSLNVRDDERKKN